MVKNVLKSYLNLFLGLFNESVELVKKIKTESSVQLLNYQQDYNFFVFVKSIC